MTLLVDMNLSPRLVEVLREAGYDTVHWSAVGDARADDTEILEWARDHSCIVVTHDLDFGAILAATDAEYPSVLQIRTQDVAPKHIAPILLSALGQYGGYLRKGALVTCDEWSSRVRILPIRSEGAG